MERRMLHASAVTSARNLVGARRRSGSRSGFTLVELAIVVAIVGVLAVIAVVGYRRYMLHAKITEAQNIISAIRIAQEDYRAERGTYWDAGATNYCPHNPSTMGNKVTQWYACTNWTALPVHVSGPVQFGYLTTAGPPGTAVPGPSAFLTFTTPTGRPWYVITAEADLDNSGDGKMTTLVTMSETTQIHTFLDGE